jgi:hypothetical protein
VTGRRIPGAALPSLLALTAALAAGACAGLLPSPDLTDPSPTAGLFLDDDAGADADFGTTIDVANGSDLALTIVVNDAPILVVAAHTDGTVKPGLLPAKPWFVAARTVSGRVVVSFSVRKGQVIRTRAADGTTISSGAGSRADLSCGRIDVTVGMPMMGPVPGPGVPGDCAP